jgi:potassium-transporting ATPase KdpC subunit
MKNPVFISLRLVIILTVITGIIYPMVITGLAQAIFHEKANGSLVKKNDTIIGSALIGQQFNSPDYFHPRPSAVNWQTFPSGASNLSWSDQRLKEAVILRKEAFLKENMLNDTASVPAEMLFASASGIDPHISPKAALLQVGRIAVSRNFNMEQKQKLVSLVSIMTEKPQYSIFGEERINVFLLNLELDKIE